MSVRGNGLKIARPLIGAYLHPMERVYPETNVFFRKLNWHYPVVVRGEGCWIYDAGGNAYIDACGGAFVVNVGHGVREIADAMARQAERLAYVSGASMTHEAVEELAAELSALAPGDVNRVYPLSSGSDAIEAALKLARQYWVEMGRERKHKIVALSPAYHGNTLLALSASAREHYKTIFGDWMVDVVRVPAPYAYRCGCRGKPPYCPACSGAALEDAIARVGPERVAAFIAEPVGGSSTGASVPPPEYFARVREICSRYGVLFIADEVLVGAGRTGTWSALAPFAVVPDIIVLGKGIAGGYAPLAAVLAPPRIVDALARGSGALNHGQTFSHHPVLCAAGVATIRYIREHRLVERCAEMGIVFHRALEKLRDLPYVGDVRGRGLLAGIEFVADAQTREPFPRAAHFAERLTRAALDAGLIVWPNVGHANGVDGDLVMLAPPFVITEEEIGEIVSRFTAALEKVEVDARV
jgi:adenosylmethionine-8-amino-7-oxononanoate aminotransferase